MTLTANIINYSGTCINNPANFTNKVFDCQGYTIDGDDTGTDYGVYLADNDDNTIQNCAFKNFTYGVWLSGSADSNALTNITAKYNSDYGIYISSSIENNITNSNSSFNARGINMYNSDNTRVHNSV